MSDVRLRRISVGAAVLSVLAISLAACGILEGDADARVQLNEARRLWAERSVEDYVYRYRRWCGECLAVRTRPYRVTVHGGAIVEVLDAETGRQAPSDYVRTVEGLFELVEDVLDHDPYRFSVAYDPRWGFPSSLTVDYVEEAVDDEFSVSAGDLAPLS